MRPSRQNSAASGGHFTLVAGPGNIGEKNGKTVSVEGREL
jgi:hypothetical protein